MRKVSSNNIDYFNMSYVRGLRAKVVKCMQGYFFIEMEIYQVLSDIPSCFFLKRFVTF